MDDRKDATRAGACSRSANDEVQRNIIVIGGSAGALDAMLDIAATFPRDFDGNILIVSHIGPNRSHLPTLLAGAGALPAGHPENGEAIRPGRIYVAPPDQHMIVDIGPT